MIQFIMSKGSESSLAQSEVTLSDDAMLAMQVAANVLNQLLSQYGVNMNLTIIQGE